MSDDLPTFAALMSLGPIKGAAFWLERLQREAIEEEIHENLFRSWLAASDANREAWDRALELWDCFDDAPETEALEQMRQDALTMQPRRRGYLWLGYAAAACVVGAISLALMLRLQPFGSDTTDQPVVAQRPDLRHFGVPDYSTDVGESRSVRLSDGSTLTLDTASAVDVAYSNRTRLVRLVRGQAYFDVAYNATRPFRVGAGERVLTVLGTQFNVRTGTGETRIFLARGSLGVSLGRDPAHPATEIARLSPGQEFVSQPGQADQVRTVGEQAEPEWRRGFVRFNGQTLAAAVAELNRYSTRQLVVRDPQIASLRISGAFPTGSVDRFVETLVALHPVQAVPASNGDIELVRAGRAGS